MFSLTLTNKGGNTVDINDGKRYLVISAGGLTPPSATIYTLKSPNRKGASYNRSTLPERLVSLSIKILGDVEKNRNALYEWIDTEDYCRINYQNGEKSVYCEGYVQDSSADLFGQNETAEVVILCPNPYWLDAETIIANISNVLAQFTFPFAIDADGVPISTIRDNNATTLHNTGAETGLKIVIDCFGDVRNFVIYDALDTSRRFAFNTTFKNGWQVVIDADGVPKSAKAYKPDGSTANLLGTVKAGATWLTLQKGLNSYAYSAESGISNAEVFLSFTPRYLGV